MEFELHADGTLTPLPKQNVDTGMGIERTARDPAERQTVYETDVYQAIMGWIADESGVAYGDSPEATKAHRILADHGRGMTFLAADGVSPVERGPRLRHAPHHPPRGAASLRASGSSRRSSLVSPTS